MTQRIVALAGGVGGAKLAEGLAAHVGDGLDVVVNTGDDCVRHGLLVMPDHDTVLYNLAGIEQAAFGWGIEGDTFAAMDQLRRYGEEAWFRLGDRDLALHVARTARLRAGGRLTDVCLGLQDALGIAPLILPMTDATVATEVRTDRRLARVPGVLRPSAPGAGGARGAVRRDRGRPSRRPRSSRRSSPPTRSSSARRTRSSRSGRSSRCPGCATALDAARARGVPVAAVSPIIGGRALKGPADRMLVSLGHEASAVGRGPAVRGARRHLRARRRSMRPWPATSAALGMRPVVTDTIMTDDDSRARLAGEVLAAVLA